MQLYYWVESNDAGLHAPAVRHAHALARMAQREGHRASLVVAADTAPAQLPASVDGVGLLQWPRACAVVPPGPAAERQASLVHAFTADPRSLPRFTAADGRPASVLASVIALPGGALVPPMPGDLGNVTVVAPSRHAAALWQAALAGAPVRTIVPGLDLIALAAQAGPGSPGDRTTLRVACIAEGTSANWLAGLNAALAGRPGLNLELRILGGDTAGPAAVDGRARGVPQDPAASAFDIGCLPGREPLAHARFVLACAALGRPCLVADVGAQAEAVRDFGCGECLSADAPEAWVDALARLADTALARRRRGDAGLPDGPVPPRLEEEAFLYRSLYRRLGLNDRS